MGGTTCTEIPFPPLPLYDETTGKPNERNVATYAALSGAVINIADIYQAEGFDFSGTRDFDSKTGYRSKSSLTIPLKNDANRVIGVLQLLNALDSNTGKVIPFDEYLQQLIESLSMLAAVALSVYIREQDLRQQIEQLFREAIHERAKVSELEAELRRWGLFDEYEDRFLNLFRKR